MTTPSHPPPEAASGTGPSAEPHAPAGWYPDPDGEGLRWWSGTEWTSHEANQTGMSCLICRSKQFDRVFYLLNTQGMSLLGLDAFNRQANCFVCRSCGFIHWFALAPPTPR